ncbi:TPA: zonular occludens toxin domain-containing protein [Escherichia coli]
MAISAYIGIPGSGKSYEAVCNVIIPAFTSGRRVVTNIYGLQKDKITERYPDATGEIIVVDNDDVLKADFFPFKGGEGSFCQFGDLIVIDEAWRIFGSDKDMTAEKKSFIAEHRHFTHPETGISCDLVIVNQSLSNIARFLKDKIETTFSVGSDVPVLGSVTVNNNTTTQSVEYRSSGVLFNVTPSIKSRTMDLKIQQQLSNFVTTETGVNNSPTLIKRDVTTEVSLADGDIILLGGLAEQKDSKASSGWSFFGSRTSESNKTDIMVMLQVRKVDRSRATPRSAARSGELFRDNLN